MIKIFSLVLIGILSVFTVTKLNAAGAFENWGEGDPDKAALILKMSDMNGRTLTIDGLKGENLDAFKWGSELPLLRRYLLPPGKYQIHFSPSIGLPEKIFQIDLEAGASKLIEIEPPSADSQSKFMLQGWVGGSPEFKSLLGKFGSTGYPETSNISTQISPPGNVFYVNIDVPYPIKPPKAPKQ